jgi:hypothetical protein
MKKLLIPAALLLAFAAPTAFGDEKIKARLTGYEEVPSVSTPASGEFEAKISPDEGMIEYELSYGGLLGTVQQAHILRPKSRERQRRGLAVQTTTTPAPAAVAGLTPSPAIRHDHGHDHGGQCHRRRHG